MKALRLVLVFGSLALTARAETALGVGVSLLARQQSSGTQAVGVSPQVRVQHAFAPFLLAAVTYDFSFQQPPTTWGMQVDAHQVSLRAVGRLQLAHASLNLELGPSLRYEHQAVMANGAVVATQQRFVPAGVGAVFVAVPLGQFEVRLGSELGVGASWDLRFNVGLLWRAS